MQKNINIEQLLNIKDQLDSMNEDDVLFVDENNQTKYAIIPIMTYDLFEDFIAEQSQNGPKVILAGDKQELTYEEYERIKLAILDMVEQTLKPKAEKLN